MVEAPEIRLTAGWVTGALEAVHGALMTGDAARVFPGVSIDTRTLAPGELFVAIAGDRFDGAEFVGAALEAGAGGIVVPRLAGERRGSS